MIKTKEMENVVNFLYDVFAALSLIILIGIVAAIGYNAIKSILND